jgi:galactokinase/mevalonate kinase-like predicted kinase
MPSPWDYLVVSAGHRRQQEVYSSQLALRNELGRLPQVRRCLVVADLEDCRIGSGASTLECLARVANRERRAGEDVERTLARLRVLIIHAGGDSRRLPAYGPCGKIFTPLPGGSGAIPHALFDRLAEGFLALPAASPGAGQVVVTSGDALLRFDPRALDLARPGLTALAAPAAPEEAAHHGVFCAAPDGAVRRFFQKPSPVRQAEAGAIGRHGRSLLDAGLMSLDARTAAALLAAFGFDCAGPAPLAWDPSMLERVFAHGLDLYREICCALGSEASLEHFLASARAGGSHWPESALAALYPALHAIPAQVSALDELSFLHFGSSRQLIESGLALAAGDRLLSPGQTWLPLNTVVGPAGALAASHAWVEGCRINAPLALGGANVVAGLDVEEPLALPPGACLDVLEGHSHIGALVWFVRFHHLDDPFKEATRFCGRPLDVWLAEAGLTEEDVWDAELPASERSLWSARLFPAEPSAQGYRRWLWAFEPDGADPTARAAYRDAERYSAAEIALLAGQAEFHTRRARLRAEALLPSAGQLFERHSTFSALDLAYLMGATPAPGRWAAALLAEAASIEAAPAGELEPFTACRLLHSLGSAAERLAPDPAAPLETVFPDLPAGLAAPRNVAPEPGQAVGVWAARLRRHAFDRLHASILDSALGAASLPRCALRPGETIWGRGPARIELGGGWTDTPPYTLEQGGDVINAAVNLNGQPPIHCYCRVITEPLVRLSSIDGGQHAEIRALAELLDYRRPGDHFALAKAALALAGFSPGAAAWPAGVTLEAMLAAFGGGIELTTLVGIPTGSGLGTSSILGAALVAVLRRLTGRDTSPRELFHEVLRLEQALTTGGGWQDQVGGGVGGVKLTSTRPGLFPNPELHFVPPDLLDPRLNGGSTLLYYTGLTRLAKNILEEIVGGYLDRRGAIMAALAEEHQVARAIAAAMSSQDAAAFGALVNHAWELQKRLCGVVTNEAIETLLARVRPYVHGMRISGAGSGGFLLMICRSPRAAEEVRKLLEREPLNDRSRFFEFEVNQRGLEVTTC